MSKVINLRQARKQRIRDSKRARGDENAAKFGEAAPIRTARKQESERATRVHLAHKRDD